LSAIFISHSSEDTESTKVFFELLKRNGFHSQFLDFDPVSGIPLGDDWEQVLYRKLRSCQAVIILCSVHSMASNWCFVELAYARALGKLIFPVRIGECTLHEQLGKLQVLDFTANREDAFSHLLERLRHAGLDIPVHWDGRRAPYPGLTAFQAADAAVFFGREDEIREARDALTRLSRFGGTRLVVFVGASGSGKSSLVRAGILPRLTLDRDHWLVVPPFRPQHWMDELSLSFAEAFSTAGSQRDWKPIREALESATDPAAGCKLIMELLRDLRAESGNRDATLVLTIDQLEEAFNDATGQMNRFATMLSALLTKPDSGLIVLGTLRADFLTRFQEHPALSIIGFEPRPVRGLTIADFGRVIEGPAQMAGFDLEIGLTQQIISSAATDDALPLLAFALRELWEHDGRGGKLTLATYKELGGVEGAVKRVAESLVSTPKLTKQEENDLRRAFLAMVRIDDSGLYVRQPARWSDLPSIGHALLNRFVDARLLVSNSVEGERLVEVAHESLFRAWDRLKTWLGENREKLRLRDGIRRAALDWDAQGRTADLLVHRASRLQDARTLPEDGVLMDPLQCEYLQACIEVERKRSQALKRRRAGVSVAGVFLVTGGFLLWHSGYMQSKTAKAQEVNTYWTRAIDERDNRHDTLTALYFFTKIVSRSDDDADIRNAELSARLLMGEWILAGIVDRAEGHVATVAFSPDNTHVVIWSGDGRARTWAPQNDREDAVALQDAQGGIERVVRSPGGERIVLWDGNGFRSVRDIKSGLLLAKLPSGRAMPSFSADEKRIAAWDSSGVVQVTNLGDAAPIASLHTGGEVRGAAFNQAGDRLLTWDAQGNAVIWNIDTGSRLNTLNGPGAITGAVINDGTGKAVVWTASSASVWNLQTDVLALSLSVQPKPFDPTIVGATFFDHGKRIAIWNYGGEGVAQIWNSETGAKVCTIQPYSRAIRNAKISADNSTVLIWSDDGTAKAWTPEAAADTPGDEQCKVQFTLRHDEAVSGATYSADGTRILTWSGKVARVWDARTGVPRSLPLLHASSIVGAAFSGDGRSIATWDTNSVRWWRQVDGAERKTSWALSSIENVLTAMFDQHSDVVALTDDGTPYRWSGNMVLSRGDALAKRFKGAVADVEHRRIAAWSEDIFGVWSTDGGKPSQIPLKQVQVTGAVPSRGEDLLASWGDDRVVRVWSITNQAQLYPLPHGGTVNGAQFADDNRILTWSEEPAGWVARVWRGTQSVARIIAGHEPIRGVMLSKDGQRILTWGDNGVRAWDAGTGSALCTPTPGTDASVKGVTLSGDERSLLVWYDSIVRIVDNACGSGAHTRAVWRVDGVRKVVFREGEQQVLTANQHGELQLWDSRNGRPLSIPMQMHGEFRNLTVGSAGQAILGWTELTVGEWRLPAIDNKAEPSSEPRVEVLTGTTLDPLNQVRIATHDQWIAARHRAGDQR
jgi:WD40 repeat protein